MILGAAVLSALVGCALTYAPGDYTGAVPNKPDAQSGDAADGDGDAVVPPGPDAAPAAPSLRLLVVAGERDGADPATSDVWSATIDETGAVSEFTNLAPGPVRGARAGVTLVDGKVLVATKTATDRVIESAAFDGGLLVAPWQTAVIDAPPGAGFGQFFAGAASVAVGGTTTKTTDDGMGGTVTTTTFETSIYPSGPDAGVYPQALVASSTKLPLGLRNITAVPYKSTLYFWGEAEAAANTGKVFLGKLDPNLGLASFLAGPSITDPTTGAAHNPVAPIACAGNGWLYVAGGVDSDTVLYARIDETGQAFGTWKAGPKLPTKLRGAGCAVWKGALHLLGGIADTTRSDKILTSAIAADGTMGAWVSSTRTLLAPRSNVFALAY